MGISHCCELVPFEFEIDSLSKVCVKSSARFALFSSGRLEVGKEMHSSGRLEVGKEMHLERENNENRERKLDVLLLKRKVLIGHPTLLEFLCFCVFLCFFVLTSFKSLLGFVRVFTDSQEIQPM